VTSPSFGFSVPQAAAFADDRLAIDDLVEFVQDAEALGFRDVVVADHILVPPNWARVIGDVFVDAFTLLAYLAAETERLQLVLGCVVVPYRQPISVAKAMATLDQLSGGRAALGVVPGYLRAEFEALGIPFDERLAMTDEFIDIMRTVWTDEHATFEGRYHSFADWNLKPKCVQQPHVPIWVGGASKGALERTIAIGDVWHPLGFVVISDAFMEAHRGEFVGETMQTDGMTPDRVRAALDAARPFAEERGRDLGTLEVVVMPGPPPASLEGVHSAIHTGSRASKGGQEIVDWFGEYVDAGATGFVLGLAGRTLDACRESLEHVAAEVMPAFTGTAAA
jgi:probable F420-dependent oxidoreductase